MVTRRRTSSRPCPPGCLQARASTWISLKQRSAAKQAFTGKLSELETAARARRQVDLEVREFRSSESDWWASGSLMHAQAIKSNLMPSQSTIKLFKWAGSIKTLSTKKIEELNRARECPRCSTHTWKGMTFYAVQCFRLSYYD